ALDAASARAARRAVPARGARGVLRRHRGRGRADLGHARQLQGGRRGARGHERVRDLAPPERHPARADDLLRGSAAADADHRRLGHERPLPGLRDRVGLLGRVRDHGRRALLDARVLPLEALALMPKPLWAPWRLEYIEQVDERPGCIFCDPEPELVLFRGEHAFLLLNRFPYSAGHLMAAPLRHAGDFGGLSDEEALEIHRLAAPAIDAPVPEYPPDGHNLRWNPGRPPRAGGLRPLPPPGLPPRPPP